MYGIYVVFISEDIGFKIRYNPKYNTVLANTFFYINCLNLGNLYVCNKNLGLSVALMNNEIYLPLNILF